MRPKNWVELGQNEEVEFDVHCKMKKCWKVDETESK